MALQFHDGQREFQDRFDTRRLADKLGGVASETIGEEFARFIGAQDMFFLATADTDGNPDCSYKGGAPGFVRVLSADTVAFPVYDGNGMFRSVGNIAVNPKVGMLFLDLGTGTRLRVNGTATVHVDDDLVRSFDGAVCAVSIRVDALFPNCRRYVHGYEQVAQSPFVPTVGSTTPVPDWKRDPWFDGALPEGDPALDPDHPSAPAMPQF